MPGVTNPPNPTLAAIPDVEIGATGTFKYILCKVYEGGQPEDFKYIVRGRPEAEFHSDIYDMLDAQLEMEGIVCECVGGGKIEHNEAEQTIRVFGKSQGYGKANHSITAEILKKNYSHYSGITWSDA